MCDLLDVIGGVAESYPIVEHAGLDAHASPRLFRASDMVPPSGNHGAVASASRASALGSHIWHRPHNCMSRDNYISFLGLLLDRFVSPSTGTVASVTSPQRRHPDDEQAILASRHQVYQAARQNNPKHWSWNTRDWLPIGAVTLNAKRDEVIAAAGAYAESITWQNELRLY